MASTCTIDHFVSLLLEHDKASSKGVRKQKKKELIKSVRKCVNDHRRMVKARAAADFSPVSWRNVTFDGVTYVTAMTAFQAQKAPRSNRQVYADLGPGEAAMRGRTESIDPTTWDAGRRVLMKQILQAQVDQHADLRSRLQQTTSFDKNMLGDKFWSVVLPKIWQEIRDHVVTRNLLADESLGKSDDEAEDDEEADDLDSKGFSSDDDDDDDDQDDQDDDQDTV